jgi:hypothetical protein
MGEIITKLGMWLFLDRKVYRRFHNVIVPSSTGTTQIDHLVVSPFGLFVIETKNIKGWIFGSTDQPKWTQTLYRSKHSFQNPLHQNYRHTRCLAEHLGIESAVMHSVVFFIGDCLFKTPMPPNVLRSGLCRYLRQHREVMLSETEVHRIADALQFLKADRNLNHATHMKSLQDRHGSSTTCPKCGSSLVEKTARKGANAGATFKGCSAFPRCRYSKAA